MGPRLGAEQVATALSRGLVRAGRSEPYVCLLEDLHGPRASGQLEEAGFDARMRAARAVVIAVAALQERALAGSLAFEIATRARQGGVPCYAVTAANRLDPFDARILDLQAVIQARGATTLERAGESLAGLAW